MIDGSPIPRTPTYKYLGFPHKRKGIDFRAHIDAMAIKAENTLKLCKRRSNAWPEIVKLSIFRSHIRSRMEYGVQLINSYAIGHTDVETLYKRFIEIWNESLYWIIPYSSDTTRTAGICGILKTPDRIQALATSFVHHFRNMANDHPAHDLLRLWKNRGPVYSPGVLLPRLGTTSLSRIIYPANEILPKTELKLRIKNWKIQRILEMSRTARYIISQSRTRGFMDKSLRIKDPTLRVTAIRWRLGLVEGKQGCPARIPNQLNHKFTRRCLVLDHVTLPQIPITLNNSATALTDGLYSKVDEFLNRELLDDFSACINAITSQLITIGDIRPISRLKRVSHNI